jgi:hypothetical protein
MNAKERAKEMYNKMLNSDIMNMTKHCAKHCALIAVDEILSIKLLWFQKDTNELNYWQEVKKEIESL